MSETDDGLLGLDLDALNERIVPRILSAPKEKVLPDLRDGTRARFRASVREHDKFSLNEVN